MTSLDLLYYMLAVCALFLVGAIWYIALSITTLVQSCLPILQDVHRITHEIAGIKNSVKNTIQIGIVDKVLGLVRFFKRKEYAENT